MSAAGARSTVVLVAAALGLPALGCGDVDQRAAAWPYIAPALFQTGCATVSCHSRSAAVAGLDFSDDDRGYESLTALSIWIVDPDGTPDKGCRPSNGTVICERPHRPLVVAYDPASSRLVNMLRARGAPRMPPDRALPEADIRLVERWILDGARKTPGGPPAPTNPYDLIDAGAGDGGGGDAGDAGTDARDGGLDAREAGADARDGGLADGRDGNAADGPYDAAGASDAPDGG